MAALKVTARCSAWEGSGLRMERYRRSPHPSYLPLFQLRADFKANFSFSFIISSFFLQIFYASLSSSAPRALLSTFPSSSPLYAVSLHHIYPQMFILFSPSILLKYKKICPPHASIPSHTLHTTALNSPVEQPVCVCVCTC